MTPSTRPDQHKASTVFCCISVILVTSSLVVVQARHSSMQFVHALSIAQIVCCDAMPPHFELAGSIQHMEVQARHNSNPFCGHYAEMYSNWLK